MFHTTEFEPHYDAIIIGARCAGAATAMLLAREGLRVLAVDCQAYGSDTLSTHALMRPAVIQLSRWGLIDRLIQEGTPVIKTSTFHYGGRELEVAIRPESGLPGLIAPRRTVLDRVLVDAARDAGATVMHGTAVHELIRDRHGRIRGVVLSDASGGKPRKLSAGCVVGADGLSSFVARNVGASTLIQGQTAVAHVYGYAPAPSGLSGYHWFFRSNAAGSVIPTNNGMACIVLSIPASSFGTDFRSDLLGSWRAALDALTPGLGTHAVASGVQRLKAFRGTAGRLRRAHGAGWMLIGDAGFFRDPLTSHGISDALRDAEGGTAAILSGREEAKAEFQDERDSLAIPILEATDAIGGFDWSLEDLPERHKRFSEAMKAEVAILTSRSVRRLQRDHSTIETKEHDHEPGARTISMAADALWEA